MLLLAEVYDLKISDGAEILSKIEKKITQIKWNLFIYGKYMILYNIAQQ